jgi:mRNA interferase RelE/StbE
MNWTIEFKNKARKSLLHFDKNTQNKIEYFLNQLILQDNPRSQGKALKGKYAGLWRYRVGDYRLICHIEDNKLIILVLDIGHRQGIYQ